jgi:hypothetical protein
MLGAAKETRTKYKSGANMLSQWPYNSLTHLLTCRRFNNIHSGLVKASLSTQNIILRKDCFQELYKRRFVKDLFYLSQIGRKWKKSRKGLVSIILAF